MTSVLVVNAGSSSLKLRVLGPDDSVVTALDLSPWDGGPDDPVRQPPGESQRERTAP